MARNTTTATATATTAPVQAPAPAPVQATVQVQAPAPAPVQAPAPVVAPMAPLFTYGPYNPATACGWPAKAASGASVRAYCARVAMALAKVNPGGFTIGQYAAALCAAQAGTTYRLPANGFGAGTTPNATARQHAAWFANTGKYLVPVQPATTPAPATPATPAK